MLTFDRGRWGVYERVRTDNKERVCYCRPDVASEYLHLLWLYKNLTGDEKYLTQAKNYFSFVYGIYLDPTSDPYKITPKSNDKTRATKALANPMILLNVASIMRDADKENANMYDEIITDLIEDIALFYKPEYHALFETVSTSNEVILESAPCRIVNPGHDMECSWFLLEEGVGRKDEKLISFARQIFDEAFERGWDKEYDGIFYFKDVLGLPVEAYEHDMKLWWVHNEAVIASLYLYKVTGETKYKEIFEKVTDYAFKHFPDPEYGEWFGYLRRDGRPTEPPCKGHTYKGPFHVMRMLSKCMQLLRLQEK